MIAEEKHRLRVFDALGIILRNACAPLSAAQIFERHSNVRSLVKSAEDLDDFLSDVGINNYLGEIYAKGAVLCRWRDSGKLYSWYSQPDYALDIAPLAPDAQRMIAAIAKRR